MTTSINVTVVERHEVLRKGIVASLAEDPRLAVTAAELGAPLADDVDIAVVCVAAARAGRFRCPIVVCGDDLEGSDDLPHDNIAGVLRRETLTAAQLRATVYAAVSGLQVKSQLVNGNGTHLDPRSRQVLELVADGYSTREIAEHMSYSERTIKKLVTALQDQLGARNRAQTVAQAMRRGLI